MRIRMLKAVSMCFLLIAAGCTVEDKMTGKNFGQDVEFLKNYVDTIVLVDNDAQVAVVPAYQGRVMTSTAGGKDGDSFGWINYEHIASGQIVPHMNAFGGEDRFWMGPEGGQFAIFFSKGGKFTLDDWQTPPVIDSEPYVVVAKTATSATFAKNAKLTNYSGTPFDVNIKRTVSLLDDKQVSARLGMDLPDSVKAVAYQSDNTITNAGTNTWEKETGLISIWILSMYKHSPQTTIVIPFKPGNESTLGAKVNDEYFGKVPAERLKVEDDILFFSGDGQYRSKIGISPQRAKPVLGSYDAVNKVLTIVQYTLPGDTTDYVNSMWEIQEKPYGGDVVNSYNDGPPEPGAKPLGPFYELESSSPAAPLAPGQSMNHVHRTFHIQGEEKDLDPIAQKLLGVGIDEIKNAL